MFLANMQKLLAFHECCQYAQMACCCASQMLVLGLRYNQMLMLASLPVIIVLLVLSSHMSCTKYCYIIICQLVLLLLTVPTTMVRTWISAPAKQFASAAFAVAFVFCTPNACWLDRSSDYNKRCFVHQLLLVVVTSTALQACL